MDLAQLACDITILRSGPDEHHVLLKKDNRRLQLVVRGRTVIEPIQLTMDVIWSDRDVKNRLASIQALNLLVQTGSFPKSFDPPDPRSARLKLVLQALDGARVGASHREIACALFGSERVDRDWSDPGNHLRDRVRRAIKRGRYLMHGGYKGLLR